MFSSWQRVLGGGQNSYNKASHFATNLLSDMLSLSSGILWYQKQSANSIHIHTSDQKLAERQHQMKVTKEMLKQKIERILRYVNVLEHWQPMKTDKPFTWILIKSVIHSPSNITLLRYFVERNPIDASRTKWHYSVPKLWHTSHLHFLSSNCKHRSLI